MGKYWNIPTLDSFIESLMHEKHNLIIMGPLKTSKHMNLLWMNGEI